MRILRQRYPDFLPQAATPNKTPTSSNTPEPQSIPPPGKTCYGLQWHHMSGLEKKQLSTGRKRSEPHFDLNDWMVSYLKPCEKYPEVKKLDILCPMTDRISHFNKSHSEAIQPRVKISLLNVFEVADRFCTHVRICLIPPRVQSESNC